MSDRAETSETAGPSTANDLNDWMRNSEDWPLELHDSVRLAIETQTPSWALAR